MNLCSVADCAVPVYARGYCNRHYRRVKRNGSPNLVGSGGGQCAAGGCGEAVYSARLCQLHYQRLTRTGRLEPVSLVERLLGGYVVDENGCWIWQGQPGVTNGYGRISIANAVLYVHRVSYETFVGPIPEGLTIDHVCRVRLCMHPGHLEPVTVEENTRREMAARKANR